MMTLTDGEDGEVVLTLRNRAGTPIADATGVTIRAKPPGLAVRSYAVSPGAGVGEFLAMIRFDVVGRWFVAGACTGPSAAVVEVPVQVTARQVP